MAADGHRPITLDALTNARSYRGFTATVDKPRSRHSAAPSASPVPPLIGTLIGTQDDPEQRTIAINSSERDPRTCR